MMNIVIEVSMPQESSDALALATKVLQVLDGSHVFDSATVHRVLVEEADA
jgi:hypothetical protein